MYFQVPTSGHTRATGGRVGEVWTRWSWSPTVWAAIPNCSTDTQAHTHTRRDVCDTVGGSHTYDHSRQRRVSGRCENRTHNPICLHRTLPLSHGSLAYNIRTHVHTGSLNPTHSVGRVGAVASTFLPCVRRTPPVHGHFRGRSRPDDNRSSGLHLYLPGRRDVPVTRELGPQDVGTLGLYPSP